MQNLCQVHAFRQEPGYKRVKRGYKPLEEQLKSLDFQSRLESPTDPYYQYQWYLVSIWLTVTTTVPLQ